MIDGDWRSRYATARDALLAQYRTLPPGAAVRLAKRTSNLFRARTATDSPGLDVADFDGVLAVDPVSRTAEVLGMTTYEHLVDATLPHGLMPMCVPQLKTITLGGAVSGLGIESASFQYGLPHESVLEMDILTGAGEVVTVSPAADDPHRDLFYGFPNSYGSLGYALRLRIELVPTKPYVLLRHIRFDTAAAMTSALAEIVDAHQYAGEAVDFVDGTVFSPTEHYVTLGRLVDEPPPDMTPSDYTGMGIYYRSVQQRTTDLLTIHDYLWRWDTDWFWCSRVFGVQRPLVRRLWPRSLLRSDVYAKLVAFDRRTGLSATVNRARRRPAREHVVQDIEVPIDKLPMFLDFLHREVGISPMWVCPMRQRDPAVTWPLYEFHPTLTYVNVGFWSTVALPAGVEPEDGFINRRIEGVVTELRGRKGLYSTAFYGREEFEAIYGGAAYERLKATYDPQGRLKGLYEKVVGRQ